MDENCECGELEENKKWNFHVLCELVKLVTFTDFTLGGNEGVCQYELMRSFFFLCWTICL